MASSEFYILENCKNPDQKIIAQLNRRFLEVSKDESFVVSAPDGPVETVSLFVYQSSNDELVGCFTLVDVTQTEGYDYYINPGPGSLFKTCIECQYEVGKLVLSNADTEKKVVESKNILTNIINKL